MPQIGLIGGTVFFGQDWFSSAERRTVKTSLGAALLLITDTLVFLPRHGLDEHNYIMPHRINHAANCLALKELGVEQIIGINSCGSLQTNILPGMITVPEDFISLFNIPSIFQSAPGHIAPTLDSEVRSQLLKAASHANIPARDGGVYWQNTGPRLETIAEIRMIRQFADFVGMTLGSEATIACELNLPYGSLCSVDNYAHGLVDEPLTEQQIREAAGKNAQNLVSIVSEYVKLFG